MKAKQKALRQKKLICCLCGREISNPALACNPKPLRETGSCCQRCDDMKVTPARLEQRGIPRAEAVTIGRNIHEAVKFARKRIRDLESFDNTKAPI